MCTVLIYVLDFARTIFYSILRPCGEAIKRFACELCKGYTLKKQSKLTNKHYGYAEIVHFIRNDGFNDNKTRLDLYWDYTGQA